MTCPLAPDSDTTMSADPSREEVLLAIDGLVEQLLTTAGVAAPPINVITLARDHLGFQIDIERLPTSRGRKRSGNERTILLPADASPEQQQWLVAQEIGRSLKSDLLRRLGVAPEEARNLSGESPANLLAQHLLVPTHLLTTEAGALDYDVLELHRLFSTASAELVAWRLLDLAEPCIITVVDNDHVQRRRSNAWRVRKELSPPEKRCQEYVNHYSRPQVLREEGWTVQGWPIHRVDWKREILRSVVDLPE